MQGGQSPSRIAWLQAGQKLLREGGAPSVKLAALTEEAGLTTGSFYHHFAGIADYVEALASFYGHQQVDEHLGSIAHLGPHERLEALIRIAGDERMQPLSAAMRDWAGSYEPARVAVQEADRSILLALEACFIELGHSTPSARTRAVLLISAGVARVKTPWSRAHLREATVLDVLA